ncbi:MAG: hypothetical protein LUD74_02765 [Tannerellaceae bacterium]|nr:hypothetical protein [Tannerellaceae bacterium]
MGAKQLIILLISLLIVPACSVNEKEIPVPVNPEQGKVPVSISITLDAALVPRSDWQYDGYFPSITEEERKVKNVFLVIFKDILLEDFAYLEDVRQEDDFSILLEGENEEDEENVFDLEPGPHYFYALLNVSPELKELLEAKIEGRENELTKSEFEKEILNKSLSDLTGEGEQFLMTNTSPPEVQAIYSDYQIEENPTLHNNIEITVGRAVGKISFAYVADQVQTGELHGGLSNIRYKILNNPAQMYLMPVIEEDILKTPPL